jgi:hypothetical protein
MPRQELFSPANAFIQGRAARQQYDAGETRNALANMELQNAPQEMAARNRLLDLQTQGAEMGIDKDRAMQGYARLRQALDSGNPRQYVLSQEPELAAKLRAQGVDLATVDDETAARVLDGFAREYAGKAGIMPAQPDPRMALEREKLQQGQTQFNERLALDRDRLNYERNKPQPPKDERLVQIADERGNPKWVRESDAVNKPAYVARDKPAAADLKYQREIKAKQPRLKAATRRVDRLAIAIEGTPEGTPEKDRIKGIAQNTFFDGGPLDAKVLKYTKQGQEVDQAKAQLLPELTALTRVPGIGSQSDLETRLAALQFPSSEFAPEVNRRAIAELRAFIADLQDAYGNVDAELSGAEAPQSPQTPASPAPAQGIDERGYASLPSGTQYRAPDGTLRTKR